MGLKDFFSRKSVETKEKMQRKSIENAAGALGLHTSASWTDFNGRVLLEEGFNSNTWAYACIRKKMQACGDAKIVVKEKNAEGEFEKASENNRISKVIKNPCQGLTGNQLVKQISGQLDIQGVFYAQIIRGGKGGNIPIEILPLPIGSVKPKIKESEVVSYKVTGFDGSETTISVNNMVVVKYTSPDSNLSINSPTSAGGKALDIDNAAADLQKISLDNRGVPDGIFELDIEDDPDGENFEEARNIIRQQYTRRESFKEPWVLQNATFKQLSQSLSDLDFMNGRKASREEICAIYEVPQPMVGILDNSTYNNIETARKVFWEDTILPLLNDIADQLTNCLQTTGTKLPEIKIEFDTTNVRALNESLGSKLDHAKQFYDLSVPLSKINERLELNLDVDDIPGAQTGYIQSSMIPISGVGGGGSEESDSKLTDKDFERLNQIIDKVTSGELGIDSAVRLVSVSISGVGEQEAREILEGISDSEAAKELENLDIKSGDL